MLTCETERKIPCEDAMPEAYCIELSRKYSSLTVLFDSTAYWKKEKKKEKGERRAEEGERKGRGREEGRENRGEGRKSVRRPKEKNYISI